MFSVVSAIDEPWHLQNLREWFLAEWQRVDPFEGPDEGFVVPSPLLAVRGPTLLGGLAFTSHPLPGSAELGLWINALLVAPEHRGCGIASTLIRAAEREARRMQAAELFVYSGLPLMYQKLGWEEIDRNESSSVLRKVMADG